MKRIHYSNNNFQNFDDDDDNWWKQYNFIQRMFLNIKVKTKSDFKYHFISYYTHLIFYRLICFVVLFKNYP